jgi:hypothetical protein
MKWPDIDLRRVICDNPVMAELPFTATTTRGPTFGNLAAVARARIGTTMSDFSLQFNRDALLAKLKQNRDAHAAAYTKAVEVYNQKFITELASKHDPLSMCLAAGKLGAPAKWMTKLVVPEEHLDEYDDLISMLELTTQVEIPLSQYQYKQYILDQWDWSRSFVSNTMSYAEGR